MCFIDFFIAGDGWGNEAFGAEIIGGENIIGHYMSYMSYRSYNNGRPYNHIYAL